MKRGWIKLWRKAFDSGMHKARTVQIPASKIGKYYFFDPRQTDAWIKRNIPRNA
jgi:hypothetical protein